MVHSHPASHARAYPTAWRLRACAAAAALLTASLLLAACGSSQPQVETTLATTPSEGAVSEQMPKATPQTAHPQPAIGSAPQAMAADATRRESGPETRRKPLTNATMPAPLPASSSVAGQAAHLMPLPSRIAPFLSPATAEVNTAQYEKITDNRLQQTAEQPVSTFSLDVDTGSYANTRRFLSDNQLPPPDAVRVEELLNYFPAEQATAERLNGAPFAVGYEVTRAPWDASKVLLRVNLQAREIDAHRAPASHLTFLVDVSGSMDEARKLPLVKQSLKMLTTQLRAQDTVSLVTYAGNTRVVLPPTSGAEKSAIYNAIDDLNAGGGTAGESGLRLAYDMARKNFVKGDVNRVLLATDGDFNLGVTNIEAIKAIIKTERESGITLSTLGYGGSNFNDALMEQIADVGNGNFSYIDSVREAEKVLKDEMGATLITVAKDVKAQIEFNPARVREWRQIGYENRQLQREDFNNDAVDAGDIGAGKRVTVLYELRLQGEKSSIDPLRYGSTQATAQLEATGTVGDQATELAFLKLRWKAPEGRKSELASLPLSHAASIPSFAQASQDTRFLVAVAAFAQKLHHNPAMGQTSWEDIANWARSAKGIDANGYRAEFVQLIKDARRIATHSAG